MNVTEYLILATVTLIVWVGHKFTWRILPGLTDSKGDLHRIPSYVFGVLCILAGLYIWCYAENDYTWFWRVVALAIAAGLGAVLPRVWDWVAEALDRTEDIEDYGQTIESG